MNSNRKLLAVWAAVVVAVVGVGVMFLLFSGEERAVKPEIRSGSAAIPSQIESSAAMMGEPATGPAMTRLEAQLAEADSERALVDGAAPNAESAASSPAMPSASSVPTKATLRAASGGDSAGLERAPPSRAVVKIGGGEIAPPNFSGHYQRVKLARAGKAEIRVEFTGDKVSEEVLVRAIHGGKINGGENYAVFDLGRGRKEIAFTFESGGEAGISEVILRRGTTEEVLQFWAPTDKPQYDPPALSVGS